MSGLLRQRREERYLADLGRRLEREWDGFAPRMDGGLLDVPCRRCPKFRPFPPRCVVPFGSRLRSCVCASVEYHLRDARGLSVLEIGCGENPFARTVVEAAGGSWTGVDPRSGAHGRTTVRTMAGQANAVPVGDASFDVVIGVQTIEHWECPHSTGVQDCDYPSAMAEVWRVLRPGGRIYFDAPIHLHGAPCFVEGDLAAIRAIFATRPWTDVRMLSWRRRYRPFRRTIAPAKERLRWPALFRDRPEVVERLRGRSAWVLSISARKPET